VAAGVSPGGRLDDDRLTLAVARRCLRFISTFSNWIGLLQVSRGQCRRSSTAVARSCQLVEPDYIIARDCKRGTREARKCLRRACFHGRRICYRSCTCTAAKSSLPRRSRTLRSPRCSIVATTAPGRSRR
jgi:hypothetical protein